MNAMCNKSKKKEFCPILILVGAFSRVTLRGRMAAFLRNCVASVQMSTGDGGFDWVGTTVFVVQRT